VHLPEDPDGEELCVEADEDSFAAIVINLVDNALKFSKDASKKEIDIGFRYYTSGTKKVVFFVRDYGPGVDRAQMRRIFQLFYRAESEMTRTTPGTGIGLALVKELAAKMGAKVDVSNREPGAEFQIIMTTSPC
jgi:signal transduction histidine kinase